MKKAMLSAAAAAILLNSTAQSAEKCMFPDVRRLKTGSEISTFVYDFWDYSKKNLPKEFKKFPFVLQGDGPSAGDYHFGNVGAYWNDKKGSDGAVDIAIIDMDDSGSGNQFADLIKMLLFVKSEYKTDGLSKLALKFYLQGLDNKDGSLMPSFDEDDKKEKKLAEGLKQVEKVLKKSEKQFDEANQDYVKRKMDGKLFSKKFGLQPLSDLSSDRAAEEARGRSEVAKLGKILDQGFQINVSGSSIGAYRFVYLVEKSKDNYLIVELKQNNCAGVVRYDEKQSPPSERFASNKANLQSAEFWKQSKVLALSPDRTYLLRVKQENLLGKIVEDEAKKDVDAYTAFFAYTLGRIHSPTANGNYVRGLTKNSSDKDFIKALEDFVAAYDKSLSSRTKK